MNPVNSFTFPSNKTATQSHSQANMLFWLDFLCDNLVYPCNTPERVSNHSKLLRSRAVVVSVGGKVQGNTLSRYVSERRTKVNPSKTRREREDRRQNRE